MMTEKGSLFFRVFSFFLGVSLLVEVQAYDILERFQYLEDKFRTQEMLREFNNSDFVLDFSAMMNADGIDFVNEAKDISEMRSSSEKLKAAQDFLSRYDKSEQNLRVALALQIPLSSFKLKGVKFTPSFRGSSHVGFLMGVQTEDLTIADIIEFIGDGVPEYIASKIINCGGGLVEGDDLVDHLITEPTCGLSPQEQALIADQRGKYFYPDTTGPNIYNYLKAEARFGFYLDYVYGKHFFGAFNLYALGRADYRIRISATSLSQDGEIAELPDDLNTTVNGAIDYHFGYRNGRFRTFIGIEDLKIAALSDNKEEGGELIYGTDPLLRWHALYLYKFSHFSLSPFVGLHKRSRYDLDKGYYLGADIEGHIWKERLGLRVRGMIDKEHFTFSPMAKLWFMHLEYMLKTPLSSKVNGLKPGTIHSLNLRINI